MQSLRKAVVTAIGIALGWTGAASAAADKAMDGWVSFPSEQEMRFTPGPAALKARFMRTVMRCAVADTGELTDCRLIGETPTGSGMGNALLGLAPKFRRKPPGPKDMRRVDIVNGWSAFDKPGDWLRRPTPSDLRAVFPVEAYKRGISGSATISCVATVQGAVSDCVTIEEFPAGIGFGEAAIALTPQFLMKPATFKGEPVPSTIRIPINFKMNGAADIVSSKRVAPPNMAWAEAPSYADVAAAYPEKARVARLAGRATVACEMNKEGRLKSCETLSSSPKNQGFEAAAKALAGQFRFQVNTPEEVKVAKDIIVHLPVTFDPRILDESSPVIGKPNWAAFPKGSDVVAAFQALKATTTLRVRLDCVVKPAGYVGDCKVVSEQPAGSGAGAVALSLSSGFRLTTWTTEGLPTIGGTVGIPLRYEPVEDAPVPAKAPPATASRTPPT